MKTTNSLQKPNITLKKHNEEAQVAAYNLPYGMGSLHHTDYGFVYRKQITLPAGDKTRVSVSGDSPQECLEKMLQKEKRLLSMPKKDANLPLADALYQWLDTVKKPVLKSQSYTRLKSTITNQIASMNIGHLRYQTITPEEIQDHINYLNRNLRLSHSTIKKTYDCLNNFYRYYSSKYKFDNPMLLVSMPIISNIITETKDVQWFDKEDIQKFINEAHAKYHTGRPKYQGALMYAANIYMGLRIGELLSLQWKDIDLDNKRIHVYKTLIEEANPDYAPMDPESKKVRFAIQKSTKTLHTRYVPLNQKAIDLILEHQTLSNYTDPDDYVICTRNRKTTTHKNASDTIRKIEQNAETKVQASGTHILRHTCASLYFKNNVPVEIIAKILGHSVDVCQNTYIHIIETQLSEAANLIGTFELD